MPTLGQAYSIECIATEVLAGLSNRASLSWLDSSGNPAFLQIGIRTIGGEIVGEATLILEFEALRTSHAQQYTCVSVLNSPALTEPLNNLTTTNVTVQSECFFY